MKPIIDFDISLSNNPRVITVADASTWEHIENKAAIIEITVPGSIKAVTNYFTKNALNKFNSINLFTSCSSSCGCNGSEYHLLPDGVYTITVKGSPDIFFKTKSYLHTANTRLAIDKLYADSVLNCKCLDSIFIDKINKLEFMLNSAEANVRLDNICTAQEILENLMKIVDKTKGCSC